MSSPGGVRRPARRPELARRFFQRAGQLDRDSPVPLYYQLQEVLKQDIDAGNWQPGQILPSEAELEDQLRVSRTVVRKALDVLAADGQVVRQKGRGVIVAAPKLRYGAAAAQVRRLPLAQQTVLSKIINVRRTRANDGLAAILQISPTHQLFEITAVTAVDDHPVSLTQAFVRCDASTELAAASKKGGELPLQIGGPELLVQLAERHGLRPHHSELSVEATTANEFECANLDIRHGTSTFLVSTVVRDTGNITLALLRSVVRSEHFRFTATVTYSEDTTQSPPAPDLAPSAGLDSGL